MNEEQSDRAKEASAVFGNSTLRFLTSQAAYAILQVNDYRTVNPTSRDKLIRQLAGLSLAIEQVVHYIGAKDEMSDHIDSALGFAEANAKQALMVQQRNREGGRL